MKTRRRDWFIGLVWLTCLWLPLSATAQANELTNNSDDGLMLSALSSPTTYSSIGDKVNYNIVVENAGVTPQSNIVVTSSLTPETPVCIIGLLSPGIMANCTSVYSITDGDMLADSLENVLSVTSNTIVTSIMTTSVIVKTDDPPSSLQLSVTVVPKTYQVAGDKLTYTYAIKNIGTIGQTDMTVNDTLFSDAVCQSGLLSPGFAATCTASYVVTEADVAAGTITGTSSVFSDQNPTPTTTNSIAVLRDESAPTFSLGYEASPASYMEAGDLITYTFTVTNDGTLPITNVTVTDPLLGGAVCQSDSLWPTFSSVCTGIYSVTPEDVDSGAIRSTATANADGFSTAVTTMTEISKVTPVTPEFSVFGRRVSEGDGRAFVRVVAFPATTVPVSVVLSTRDDTAMAGVDYISTREVVRFAPGSTERSVPIDIIDNDVINATPVRSFKLLLSDPENGILDTREGMVEIVDDEEPCTPGNPPGALTYLSAKYKSGAAKSAALQPTSMDACEETVYYRHVDPGGAKNSLDHWLRAHDFLTAGAPEMNGPIDQRYLDTDVRNAEYHNMIDLGFGRDMYCKRDGEKTDTFPCVVQNYLVSTDLTEEATEPASYQLSVTMEFLRSCDFRLGGLSADCGPTAFFVYDNEGRRVNSVDLDGDGRKRVPQVCLACHGGEYADDGVRVTTIEGGAYLPFDERLFSEFERDVDTTTDVYDPDLATLGLVNHEPTRRLNSLLEQLFSPEIIASDNSVADLSIGRIEDPSRVFTVWHNTEDYRTKVRNTYCAVCHLGVEGNYALTNADGANCDLCHDNVDGDVLNNSNLALNLCGPDATKGPTFMPNAKVTHQALFNALQNENPYGTLQLEAMEFINQVCEDHPMATSDPAYRALTVPE